jgi:hypothetical protein
MGAPIPCVCDGTGTCWITEDQAYVDCPYCGGRDSETLSQPVGMVAVLADIRRRFEAVR